MTGGPLAASDLTKLTFHKNGEGKYHCPVLFKVFNSHSHIVAVKTTGNVYSYEAVKELNMKTKNMKDLLDSTPFTKADLITIQAAGPHRSAARVARRRVVLRQRVWSYRALCASCCPTSGPERRLKARARVVLARERGAQRGEGEGRRRRAPDRRYQAHHGAAQEG